MNNKAAWAMQPYFAAAGVAGHSWQQGPATWAAALLPALACQLKAAAAAAASAAAAAAAAVVLSGGGYQNLTELKAAAPAVDDVDAELLFPALLRACRASLQAQAGKALHDCCARPSALALLQAVP